MGKREFSYIVPWHPGTLQNGDRLIVVLINTCEVEDPGVVVLLSREQGAGEISWMTVGQRVGVRVPAAKAEVEATDAGAMVVYNDHLLVV